MTLSGRSRIAPIPANSRDMMEEEDKSRRKFLKRAVSLFAAFGAGMASLPFIRSLGPSQRSIPVSHIIEFPKLAPGQILAYSTRWFKTIYVLRRDENIINMLEEGSDRLRDPLSLESEQPDFAQNRLRSLNPEYLIVESECTHLGCGVAYEGPGSYDYDEFLNRTGGFFCPCHGSTYDAAGRVNDRMPAPKNLVVPYHEYVTDTSIEVFKEKPG